MKILTAPSLFASDLANIESEVKRTEQAGADLIHFDVMDGVYVPNLSFGFDMLKAVRRMTQLPLDVHMMTACPWKYIKVLAESGADIVTVHNDVTKPENILKIIDAVHHYGMMAGIALKPGVDAEAVVPFINKADMILCMTVEPGFSGQKFMDMSAKIAKVREYIGDRNVSIEVDGGIKAATAQICAAAGANVFVVGSASYGAPSMKAALDEVKSAAESVYPG